MDFLRIPMACYSGVTTTGKLIICKLKMGIYWRRLFSVFEWNIKPTQYIGWGWAGKQITSKQQVVFSPEEMNSETVAKICTSCFEVKWRDKQIHGLNVIRLKWGQNFLEPQETVVAEVSCNEGKQHGAWGINCPLGIRLFPYVHFLATFRKLTGNKSISVLQMGSNPSDSQEVVLSANFATLAWIYLDTDDDTVCPFMPDPKKSKKTKEKEWDRGRERSWNMCGSCGQGDVFPGWIFVPVVQSLPSAAVKRW